MSDEATTDRETPPEELDRVLARLGRAAAPFAAAAPRQRADMLRDAAALIDAAADRLVPVAERESRLPTARLRGELGRTTYQLRFMADLVEDGTCFGAVIEHANADAPLGSRPDLRRVGEAIGTVLVFAASNFPFAFSVAGGDTAAALAVGCPVVVKAHPGHPRLSDEVGGLLAAAGLPVAVVHGVGTGRKALEDHRVRAAAFTGSTTGGRALMEVAAGRPDPIPFHGELGSINPVVVTPGAVAARGREIVTGFVASFTLGVGQFCTKPGLLLLPSEHGLEEAIVEETGRVAAAPMLGERIRERYLATLGERRDVEPLTPLVEGVGTAPTVLVGRLLAASSYDELVEECFGPLSIVLEYDDVDDLVAFVSGIEGSLTGTLHSEPSETGLAARIVDAMRPRVGRIVHDGWPTGVAVSRAMHHGGPWPAATSPLHGSVGGTSIDRFLVPRCYQDVPDELLPPALQEDNPLGIQRTVDPGR